ncbi:carboxypeptidase regulatory-like domain-containing protein [Lachnoclostridium sp. MSJ-17]|uniref:carboxypeptidase regulatory-like domain-containing protein n=1 Tax=Lachnoclostridium sp. MSJ-17 TaxID=2841516 RepID=UPI001C11AF4B|nr:carboxypeptidase regulatory-like domain-containing protein [Lachnoclostridium sp. MSJ-17]MBU5462734.1 carboxypeptidase regulatory-like domain-containing protein [Lachnoclostridium sp. MSJ-17]
MKRLNRTSVRAVSIILALLMCVTMIPVTAFAAQKEADESVGENGPASASAYVALNDGYAWKYPYRVKTGAATVLDGAGSYDPDTNTLTLNNFSGSAIETNKMGEDFKIRLIGKNTVANGVNIWGDGWGASAFITGDGTLTTFGITVMAEGAPAVFSVGPDARVTAEGGGITVYDSSSENPLRFSGKERSGGKPGRVRSTTPALHPSYDLSMSSYGEDIYYNPTHPYAQYSQYAETEYFACRRTVHSSATRAKDRKTMKAVSFTLREVRHENDKYVWYSTITQIYVWEDTDLYQRYKNNLEDLTLEAYDPNYQLVTEESFSETEWAVVDNLGEPLANVDIVPQAANVMMFPTLEAAELDDALMGKFYTAQLHASPANGGRITDFSITGSASEWLNIDSKGKLSGKPRSAGVYSLYATATETVDGVSLDTLPVRYRILVKEPTNMLTFASSVTDKAAHTLTFEKTDGSFAKTMDIGNGMIGEGRAFSLDGFPVGEYKVTLTASMNGASVSYANPTASFTLAEGQHNNISFNPGASTVTPNAGSVSLKVNNFSALKDYYTYLSIQLADGSVLERTVNADTMFFPDLLEGRAAVESFTLYVSDAAGRAVKATSGEIVADGNSLTANAAVSGITEYTVVGLPKEFSSIIVRINQHDAIIVSQPENSWETPTFRLATLSEDDELTTSFCYNSYGDTARAIYDIYDKPVSVTLSGTEIKLDVPKLDKTGVIRGKVTDRDDKLVAGASIICSQFINGRTVTFSAVSDENGDYRFEGLFAEKLAKLSITADGYVDTEDSLASVGADTEHDITVTPVRYISLTFERPLTDASIHWSGKIGSGNYIRSLGNQSGASFLLPVPYDANGTFKVYVSSRMLAYGHCEESVEVTNGSGSLTMNPAFNGKIDAGGCNELGERVAEYNAEQQILYVISTDADRNYFSTRSPNTTFYVPEGHYRVEIRDRSDTDSVLGSQELEATPEKTAYLTAPVSSEPENTLGGSVTAPLSAPKGDTYKIECTIRNDFDIDRLVFYLYDSRYLNWDSGVKGVVINGKTAGIEHNNIWKKDNPQIDWSYPMRITFYVEQRATATTDDLLFKLKAVGNGGQKYLIGESVTAYAPNISLRVADAITSTKKTNADGHAVYTPDSLSFYGDTDPNTDVTLYDNGTPVAKATSNNNGRYSGTLKIASEDTAHKIRAEVTSGGKTMYAEAISTYNPGGACLRTIWFNGNEMKPGAKLSYITGVGGYTCQVAAAIDNPDRLDDVTYCINGEDVTGKVFFKITTVDGDRIVKAESNTNQTRWYTNTLHFEHVYPTGVKVLYRSKAADHTYADTFTEADGTESNINVDLGVKGKGESSDSYIKDLIKLTMEGYSGEGSDPVSANDEEKEVTSNDLYNAMVWKLNQGEGEGTFKTLTAEQAAAKVPADKAEIRTYTDEPKWTVNAQNLHLKMVELQEKGYQTYSYLDENTGHKIYLFSGKFYYAQDAKPVPSLQITKIYSGIPKTEDDPRMFKDGVMIGSTLEVQYMCDVTAGKWYRTQTATMPGGVRSAIHTSGYQIPSTWEAPFSYKDTNVFPVSTPDDEAVGAQVGGDNLTKQGISFEIDFKRVSAQTYVGGAISVGGFCYGKMASATYFNGVKVINKQTGKAMDLVDIGLDKAINKGKNIFYAGVSKESLAAGSVVYSVSKLNEGVVEGGTTVNDIYDAVYTQIRDNIRYYGKVKTAANYTAEHDNANVLGDFTLDKYKADRMLQKSRDMADAVVELQQAIENAQHQDEFTQTVTEQIGYLSIAASCAPGVGTEASLILDAMCFIMSAANDTRNSKVSAAAEKFMEKYRAYIAEDEQVKDEITESEERVEKYKKWGFDIKTRSDIVGEDMKKKKKKTPSGGGGGGGSVDPTEPGQTEPGQTQPGPTEPGQTEPGPTEPGQTEPGPTNPGPTNPGPTNPGPTDPGPTDPGPTDPGPTEPAPPTPDDSGGSTGGGSTGGGDIDIEVIPAHDPSGRVYEAVASNTIEGATVTLYRYASESNPMSQWDDSDNLRQDNPLTTDADGFYRWDVPEGEWYVIAEKDGYISGSSQNDTAALVNHNGTNYLPVLPPQLDVNIPLVSYAAPEIESISAKSDGVYITFSKYMDESTVVRENFELLGEDGSPLEFKLDKLDSEQAPSNINYGGEAPYYTKTVRLRADLPLDKEFFVKVSEKLTSYAGTPMVSAYSDAVYADEKRTLAAPVFSVNPGEVDRNTPVTIKAEDGAKIIYTTDGSEPTAENGKLAKSGTTVVISSDMTLKAIAVKFDANTSEVTTGEYTVKIYVDTSFEPDYTLGDVNKDGTIDINDVTLLQKALAELEKLDDAQTLAADVTGDGNLTIDDATTIQKFLAEIIDHFG